MTGCPGYLGLKVTERSLRSSVEVIHYDLLILCPVRFNLSVNIAYNHHHHQHQSMTSYDVTLTDAQQTLFHSFHTHVRIETYIPYGLFIFDIKNTLSMLIVLWLLHAVMLTFLKLR